MTRFIVAVLWAAFAIATFITVIVLSPVWATEPAPLSVVVSPLEGAGPLRRDAAGDDALQTTGRVFEPALPPVLSPAPPNAAGAPPVVPLPSTLAAALASPS